jgi:hypothetical protein
LSELLNWAKKYRVSTQWQSLYYPEHLDPLKLGPEIRRLALKELQTVLERTDLETGERSFLQQAADQHQIPADSVLVSDLIIHINEIESKYHPDTTGRFAELWPEISKLI